MKIRTSSPLNHLMIIFYFPKLKVFKRWCLNREFNTITVDWMLTLKRIIFLMQNYFNYIVHIFFIIALRKWELSHHWIIDRHFQGFSYVATVVWYHNYFQLLNLTNVIITVDPTAKSNCGTITQLQHNFATFSRPSGT